MNSLINTKRLFNVAYKAIGTRYTYLRG